MAARIPLVKNGSATSGPANNGLNRSIHISLADPPYLFDVTGFDTSGVAWTGSILIQSTPDTMPPANGGGFSSNDGVSDANARWETIITLTPTSGPVEWKNPLYRIRANTSSVGGAGTPTVYMLEGIRSLKNHSLPKKPSKSYASRNGY